MTTLLLDLASIAAGLALLFIGAELLVRASTSIGQYFGMSRLVIGLTIVAFSTSAPEIIVSVQAAWDGQGDISMGNVFGSNMANIGLILGAAACVRPLSVHFRSIRLDGPVMVATTLLAGYMAWDGRVGRIEGAVLLGILLILITARIQIERTEARGHDLENAPDTQWPVGWACVGLVIGLLLLATGGDWLIQGSIGIATRFSVPEAFIAVTVVSIGTSLPELTTSLVAAFRGQSDIAVGNVLGSNIFNACGVLGLAALTRPLAGAGFHPEIVATTLMGLVLLPFLASGRRLVRWEGALLIAAYAAVLLYLI